MSRFDKYREKFKPDSKPKPVTKTIGDVMSEQAVVAIKKHLDEVVPIFCKKTSCQIYTNAASFWDLSPKQIVVTVLVTFSEDTIWKEES